jgi:hypothetical protein
MRKLKFVQSYVSLITLAAAFGITLVALSWWQLHPAVAVALGAGTFVVGWMTSLAMAFIRFLSDISRTVPCPQCQRALSVWNLRADGKPVRCPACGVLAAEARTVAKGTMEPGAPSYTSS